MHFIHRYKYIAVLRHPVIPYKNSCEMTFWHFWYSNSFLQREKCYQMFLQTELLEDKTSSSASTDWERLTLGKSAGGKTPLSKDDRTEIEDFSSVSLLQLAKVGCCRLGLVGRPSLATTWRQAAKLGSGVLPNWSNLQGPILSIPPCDMQGRTSAQLCTAL